MNKSNVLSQPMSKATADYILAQHGEEISLVTDDASGKASGSRHTTLPQVPVGLHTRINLKHWSYDPLMNLRYTFQSALLQTQLRQADATSWIHSFSSQFFWNGVFMGCPRPNSSDFFWWPGTGRQETLNTSRAGWADKITQGSHLCYLLCTTWKQRWACEQWRGVRGLPADLLDLVFT